MNLSSFLSGISLLAWLAAAQQAPPPAVEEQPAVDPATTYQSMTGFGAGVFEGTIKEISRLKPGERERMYDLLYTDKGVSLNIVRFHISWTAEPLAESDPLRARGLNYDWPKDAATQQVYAALSPIFARTKPIVYAVPFTPPVRWKAGKERDWGGAFLSEHYRDYALYLADFLKYSEQEQNLKIDILSLQNEPDVAAPWASPRWTGEQLRDFLKVLAGCSKQRGLSFMLPEGST